MKFNLKNRPIDVASKEFHEWLFGFEAELRDILRQHESGQYWSADVLIKEVLGDET